MKEYIKSKLSSIFQVKLVDKNIVLSRSLGSIFMHMRVNLHLKKDQKHRPEVFCKKSCSQKFRKIHRKTPVPESLF